MKKQQISRFFACAKTFGNYFFDSPNLFSCSGKCKHTHQVIVTILFVHERGNSGTLRAA